MMKKEIWDLIDKNGKPIGKTIEKGDRHPEGTYHKVVGIWIIAASGKALLTKRSDKKEQFPGLWENTGGSVLSGETGINGAIRELYEEIGLKVERNQLSYLDSILEKTALVEIYKLSVERELSDLHLQDSEVADMKWVTKAEWNTMAAEHQISGAALRRLKIVETKLEEGEEIPVSTYSCSLGLSSNSNLFRSPR